MLLVDLARVQIDKTQERESFVLSVNYIAIAVACVIVFLRENWHKTL